MPDPAAAGSETDTQDLSDRLRDACVFRGFSDDERLEVVRSMVCDEFAPGEVIIRQDTMTRNAWVLIDGDCEVVKEPPIGEYGVPVPLALLHPFDVFGEMALVSCDTHVASVEARTPVRTLRLRGEDFDELARSRPQLTCRLACNLLHIVSQRLRRVDEKLSRSLDSHDELRDHDNWQFVRGRLGRLYAGSPK